MARVNRAVELLAQDQPIYYQHLDGLGSGGEEAGRSLAGTWADYLAYDAEHAPFDAGELRAFVSGLVKGDPTRSGHRTPRGWRARAGRPCPPRTDAGSRHCARTSSSS